MKLRNILLSTLLLAAASAMAAPQPSPAPDVQTELSDRQSDVSVRVKQGSIEVTVSGRPTTVMVYAITGQLVRNVSVEPGTTTIDLPAGCYIVRSGRNSQRVVVR